MIGLGSDKNRKLYLETYLIFVIFFTQTRFLENKIYTEKRVNYNKRISRQNSVNCDLFTQSLSNYTLSVKAHLVCVKIKNTHKLHKVCQITQRVSNYYIVKCQFFALYLEKFTLGKLFLHKHRWWCL